MSDPWTRAQDAYERERERLAIGERDEETDEERDERERQEAIRDDHAWEETKARRHARRSGVSDD